LSEPWAGAGERIDAVFLFRMCPPHDFSRATRHGVSRWISPARPSQTEGKKRSLMEAFFDTIRCWPERLYSLRPDQTARRWPAKEGTRHGS
jgi:hypothetical protein